MSYQINQIYTMYEKEPMGMDVEAPCFSWKFASDDYGLLQASAQILVGTEEGMSDCWDSGEIMSDCSTGISYGGKPLRPCMRYYVTVKTTSAKQEKASASTFFETGLLDPSLAAWDGAKWIGAPEYFVSSDTMGVFVIESEITIKDGSRAGIVFGANDERLLNKERNEYLIEGENYIRYEINLESSPASLDIYRVGYDPNDTDERPFASAVIEGITKENAHLPHLLRVEVTGNCAFAYIDGVLVDGELADRGHVKPRQLNPLSDNDTTCYPRLCEVGYFAAKGTHAAFSGIMLRHYRQPSNLFRELDTEEGVELVAQEADVQIVKDPSVHSLPMLRTDFTAHRPITQARLYVTARGIYECMINGERISSDYFPPGASQYDKHLMYQTYDVSGFVREGCNGISFLLAPGWWSDAQTFVVRNYNFWGDKPSVMAKLVVTYQDGTSDVTVTNTDWQYYGEGPYIYASFFQGEHYDANRKECYDDFSCPAYFIWGMQDAAVIQPSVMDEWNNAPGFMSPWPQMNKSEPKIVGHHNAPVRIVEELTAKSRTEPAAGVYIYDLEQEIAGVPKIKFHGKKGTRVVLRFGESLYPELEEYGALHGRMLQVNLRDASSTDIYIMRGDDGGEWYSPRFTFHGYRYIEITGVDIPPEITDVKSYQLSSVTQITGQIEVDHELLMRFIKNVTYSQLSNFISIPTDCPQRNERMGWAGDTHVFCRTATYQSDVRLFYYRYLEALADLQDGDGKFPDVAPFGGGFGGITYGSAMLLMCWELYQQYGDARVIAKYYPAMESYMQYLKKKGLPGDVYAGPLGDWLSTQETDNALLWNAFYARDAALMKRFAGILEKTQDDERYQKLETEAKDYWNSTFVDGETGKTRSVSGASVDTQTSYSLPLSFDVFHPTLKEKAYANLAGKVGEDGVTVTAGFFGCGNLNPMLSAGGYHELAYQLMTQTNFPGWLYPVTQGATTIWERWDSFTKEGGYGGLNAMNSFNHYSLGSVLSWLYESVLGIVRDEACPGYKHFYLKPNFHGFTKVSGGTETPYGRIESAYVKDGDKVRYRCVIPPNTTATIILAQEAKTYTSGAYEFVL